MENRFNIIVKKEIKTYGVDIVYGNHIILFNDGFEYKEPLFTHQYVTKEEAIVRAFIERHREYENIREAE